jgi:hypothetical protein
MPKVKNFATAGKHRGAFPDPLSAIADDDEHGVGAQPTQFSQLRPEMTVEQKSTSCQSAVTNNVHSGFFGVSAEVSHVPKEHGLPNPLLV